MALIMINYAKKTFKPFRNIWHLFQLDKRFIMHLVSHVKMQMCLHWCLNQVEQVSCKVYYEYVLKCFGEIEILLLLCEEIFDHKYSIYNKKLAFVYGCVDYFYQMTVINDKERIILLPRFFITRQCYANIRIT